MTNFIGIFTIVPLAYLSNRLGKKKMGQSGNIFQLFGLIILYSVSFVESYKEVYLSVGVFIYAIGASLFKSTWFALLDPLVMKEQRVTFFATLRTFWKIFSLIFGLVVQLLLVKFDDSILSSLVLLVTFMTGIQLIFYQQIPEIEKHEKSSVENPKYFKEVICTVLFNKNFLGLLKLKFIFPFMTGSIALIFNLYEKNVLMFKSDQIIMMGNCMFVGSLIGFWVGAWMVKKWGEMFVIKFVSRLIFLLVILFLASKFTSFPLTIYVGCTTCLFGLATSVVGIAETTLMLELLPKAQKAVASAVWLSVTQLGFGCSGLISAFVIGTESMEWMDGGENSYLNKYSLLLIFFTLPLPVLITIWVNRLKSGLKSH